MEKRAYSSPQLQDIGDMTRRTLGNEGSGPDSASRQAGGNGSTSNQAASTRGRESGSPFDRSAFDRDIFK